MAKASLLSNLIYPSSNGFKINIGLVYKHLCYRRWRDVRSGWEKKNTCSLADGYSFFLSAMFEDEIIIVDMVGGQVGDYCVIHSDS